MTPIPQKRYLVYLCQRLIDPWEFFSDNLGRVVRKPINANPGLKVNQSINLSCIKMFFTTYVFCSLRLFKLKTEGQTLQTEKLTEKLQN